MLQGLSLPAPISHQNPTAVQVGDQEGPGFVLSRRGAKLRRLHGDEVEDTLLLGASINVTNDNG